MPKEKEKAELTAATLHSVALNYKERKGPKQPKTLCIAVDQLKCRDDIIITKPDKGSGIVMEKVEYFCLLTEASINDTIFFFLYIYIF